MIDRYILGHHGILHGVGRHFRDSTSSRLHTFAGADIAWAGSYVPRTRIARARRIAFARARHHRDRIISTAIIVSIESIFIVESIVMFCISYRTPHAHTPRTVHTQRHHHRAAATAHCAHALLVRARARTQQRDKTTRLAATPLPRATRTHAVRLFTFLLHILLRTRERTRRIVPQMDILPFSFCTLLLPATARDIRIFLPHTCDHFCTFLPFFFCIFTLACIFVLLLQNFCFFT